MKINMFFLFEGFSTGILYSGFAILNHLLKFTFFSSEKEPQGAHTQAEERAHDLQHQGQAAFFQIFTVSTYTSYLLYKHSTD